jgi:hypothetical protein
VDKEPFATEPDDVVEDLMRTLVEACHRLDVRAVVGVASGPSMQDDTVPVLVL